MNLQDPLHPGSAQKALFCLLLLSLFLFLVPGLMAQVIEEEDLVETELETPVPVEDTAADEGMKTLFDEAADLFFNSEDPAPALVAFDRLLDFIESQRLRGELSPLASEILQKSLGYRAELRFEQKDADGAEADLGRMLQLDPRAVLDAEVVSAELLKKYEAVKKERVGHLRITATPADLELLIDGRPIEVELVVTESEDDEGAAAPEEDAIAPPSAEAVATLLAGIRLLEARRSGYAPLAHEVEVVAGRESPFEVVLERTSAVARLHSRPRGAEVTVDGIPYGTTAGLAEERFLQSRPGLRRYADEFSAEFLIPDLEAGLRVLEVKKEGYRTYRSELRVQELIDYEMPPIVLERERGTVVLRNLPADAELEVNGRKADIENRRSSTPRLTLPPGEHHIQISQGRTRMFSTRVQLADRQSIDVNVRLSPGLAFLGVFGAEREDLSRALRLALGDSERWSVLDRSSTAREVLKRAGFTAEAARRAADGDVAAVDWSSVQTAVDAQAPGLVYLAAVLTDDLLGSQADVWIWTAAPGPAHPDRLRLDLGQQTEIARLREFFHQTVQLRRPSLGALVMTTDATPHPVVAHLVAESPLYAAGVRPGDQVVAISGVPVFSGADVEVRLNAAETGESVDIGIQPPSGATQNARIVLGTSPLIHSRPLPNLPDAVAFTEFLLLDERARPEEKWIIRLNQALILLRARDFEGTVRILRDLEAPENADGVGRATVDYWLGIALIGAGTSYNEAAIEAFRRAAAEPGARLDHDDGPWIAPRARARLLTLGDGS